MIVQLPTGFVDRDHGRLRVIAPRLAFEDMARLLDGTGRAADPVAGGRGGARRVVLPGGQAVFCRHYLRGGMMRHFVRDLFLLKPERPIAELVITEAARAAGCSVAPVLACAVEDVGLLYRGWIVTAEVPGARPLIDVLVESAAGARRSLLERVGDAIADLHRIGVYHVDLTGHNVLVRPDGRPVIIDFDRARRAEPGSPARAGRSLARFKRSLDKLLSERGGALDAEEWALVTHAGDGGVKGARRVRAVD